MRSMMKAPAVCLCATILFGSSLGCVSKAEFDQLMFENRSLASEKEQYAQRALDAEAASENLRRQIGLKESELDMSRSIATNLQAENDRLAESVGTAQSILERINLDPEPPLVISNPLPPELDAALKNFAASHPNSVDYDSRLGVVRWKSDLLFPSGKDTVREDAKSTLRTFANIVNTAQAQDFEIMVVGHTDNDPIKHAKRFGHHTNWHLASHRAIAVGQELVSASINPDRLGILGYGEHRPATNNSSPEGKAQNRRVEIMIIGRPNRDTATSQVEPVMPTNTRRDK